MDNIYLVGYRATGKSTVGKALAAQLNRSFVDADQALEREQGKTISQIVTEGGWEEFRRLEKALLTRLSALEKHVIAPGGGAVLDPDNAARMRETGWVVWLTASPETIHRRLSEDENTASQRPALTDKGVLEEISHVLAQRTPLYQAAAGLAISTDGMDARAICEHILDAMPESATER